MGRNSLNPLPFCEAIGEYYWRINLILCINDPEWSAWQAHKDMAEIIPEIDKRILDIQS